MAVLVSDLSRLPPAQLKLWPELGQTPETFTLYGGTALALRLGHRTSIDFDFFSHTSFDPEHLALTLPFLKHAERIHLAGTKAAVVQRRAEAKDYLDIDALLRHGMDLPAILAAGRVVYGRQFNPLITLRALSFFDDVPALSNEIRKRLTSAVATLDMAKLPMLENG
jgi:hypothetical protein